MAHRAEGKRERERKPRRAEIRWREEGSDTPPVGVAFEGDDDSFYEEQILMEPRTGGAYLQPGKRGIEEEERRREWKRPWKGYEKEGDGIEASSTVLGYSLPVSWGPCCTRTILFFFLFFNALLAPAREPSSSFSLLLSYFSPCLSSSPSLSRADFLSFRNTSISPLFSVTFCCVSFFLSFFHQHFLSSLHRTVTIFATLLLFLSRTLQLRFVRVLSSFTCPRSDRV